MARTAGLTGSITASEPTFSSPGLDEWDHSLFAAGCEFTVCCLHHRQGVTAAAGAAAAVVGSADGVWRKHVDQVRARLDISYGGDEVTDEAAAQVARAASDIDAAKLQITDSLDPGTTAWALAQSVTRARSATDRLLASSKHALNSSDPVTHRWRDVHAGCRLALPIIDGLASAQSGSAAIHR